MAGTDVWFMGNDAKITEMTVALMEQYKITAVPIKRPLGWLAGVLNADSYANDNGYVEGKVDYANTAPTFAEAVALVAAEIREGGG